MFFNRESYLSCPMKTAQKSTLAMTPKLTYAQGRAWRVAQAAVMETAVVHLFVRREARGICMVLLVLASGAAQRPHILFLLESQVTFLGLWTRLVGKYN